MPVECHLKAQVVTLGNRSAFPSSLHPFTPSPLHPSPLAVSAQPQSGPCPVPAQRSDARRSGPPSRMVPKGSPNNPKPTRGAQRPPASPYAVEVWSVAWKGQRQLDKHNSGGLPRTCTMVRRCVQNNDIYRGPLAGPFDASMNALSIVVEPSTL